MKKIIKSLLSMSMIMFVGFSFCLGAPFLVGGLEDDSSKFPFDKIDTIECDGNTDLGNCVSIRQDEKISGSEETLIRRLLGVFGLDNNKGNDLKFIDYVKAIINMALGLMSMVALIMTIYTFYLMYFTENEAGAKKAKGNLVGIFIALAVVGLAWMIVSFIFWWYNENWQSKNGEIVRGEISMINYESDNQIYLNV